ncbi:hypothetical protein [Ekhidna sp.]|uniref:hypothetical protein n=1 Tax=Ekhidna sp. TaxID=2608089 RepID=UPI003299B3CF
MNCRIFCLLLTLVFAPKSFGQNGSYTNVKEPASYHKVKITSSAILINGTTNVNRFQCGLDQPALNDSIVVKDIWSNQKLDFEGLRLVYKIKDFECGIRAMDSDFQELLKADTDPYLLLQLNSITLHAGNQSFEELNVDAEVEIFMAGVEKTIEISGGKVYNHSSAHLTLKGKKELFMSDFEIAPPTKFFGVVKVTDDIEIEFEISMEVSTL